MTKKSPPSNVLSNPPRHLFQVGQMWKSAHKGKWGGSELISDAAPKLLPAALFFFSCRDEEKEIKEGKESNLFPQRRAGAFRSQTMGR